MSANETITVTGLRETQKALYSYSQQLGDRVIRRALRQGANHVLRGIKELVPVKTGLLKRRGFRVSNSKIHNGRISNDMIGVYLALRKRKGDPFYGRFQNDGWVPQGPGHALKGGTRRRDEQRARSINRKIPGKQFVQQAFAQRREAAVQIIIRSAEAGAEVVKRKLGLK